MKPGPPLSGLKTTDPSVKITSDTFEAPGEKFYLGIRTALTAKYRRISCPNYVGNSVHSNRRSYTWWAPRT